jgi:3-oxoadipate enol-lactonase
MRFRLSNGLSLRYRSRGAGRPMVLLHPVGLRLEFWDRLVTELQGELRLIVPDARGHGESDVPPAPFSLDDMADDTIELLRAVGGGKAVVVGCSMGGMVAQAIALRAPELLAGVVVANTSHTRTAQGRAVMERRAVEAMAGMPAVLDTTLSRWFSETVRLREPEKVAQTRDWLLEADPVVHAWSWRAIRDLAHDDRLGAVHLPALAIAGSDDQSTAPAAVHATAQALANCAYRELAHCGHLAPLEQPARFAALLRDFVATLPPE